MFEKLSNAFSNVAKSLGEKELKENDIDEMLTQLEISLLESDVATEVIDNIKSDLKEKLVGVKVNKKEIEDFVLLRSFNSLMKLRRKEDLVFSIEEYLFEKAFN